jgi:hypothetical protein
MNAARLVLVASFAIGSGCGYSAGPLTRHAERRVHLPMFENRTFYRDLEIDLTRQVEKELASRPGISIVPLERADIVLAGAIVGFDQHVLSEDPQDRVRESSVTTHIRMEVRDPQSGTVRRFYELTDRAEFLTQRGETLSSAAAESFFDLARRIVDGLEDDFPHASAAARAGS